MPSLSPEEEALLAKADDVCNIKSLQQLLILREARGMQEVGNTMMERVGGGAHWFDVWMGELSDRVQGAARAFGERIIM